MVYTYFLFQEFAALFCFVQIVYTAPSPYQYNTFSSTPSYMVKQNLNMEPSHKYSVGYKVQDSPSNKVKKEFSNNEYSNLFIPDTNKRSPSYSPDFSSFDETYSTTSANLLPYPYTGKLSPVSYASADPKPYVPPTASSKIFIHHEPHEHGHHSHHGHHGHHGHHVHDKHHFVHDVVGHYITDVAGHKLRHVGEALESGELTEPIIHKLSFAKAALLQLLAIIGPLSAIKTIHVVAKASEPHHHEPDHAEPPAIGPYGEHSEHHGAHPYPHTLVGMIMHFVAQLSKFNTDAKLHLIPNLLKVVSYASSSSAHVSNHHPH